MACYSFNSKIIGRGSGKSVVCTGAYNNRERLTDNYYGITYDYSNRQDVTYKGILLPLNAPSHFLDHQIFFDELDKAEKRKDAQVARAIIMALPIELSSEEQLKLVKDFCEENFTRKGYCVNYAIHQGILEKNQKPRAIQPVMERKDNPHAHLIIPFRKIDEFGFQKTKLESRTRNRKAYLISLRKSWADIQNKAFRERGLDISVSHESLAAQGINRKPTRHIGAAAMAQELKGIPTKRGNQNLDILRENQPLKSEQKQLEHELKNREQARIASLAKSVPLHQLTKQHPISQNKEHIIHHINQPTHEYERERY